MDPINLIIIGVSMVNISILLFINAISQLNILEKSYVYISAIFITVLILSVLFKVKNKLAYFIPHFIYTLLVIVSPFMLKNRLLLWFYVFTMMVTIWSRYYIGGCMLSKIDNRYGSNLLAMNSDKFFLLFLILGILRLTPFFD